MRCCNAARAFHYRSVTLCCGALRPPAFVRTAAQVSAAPQDMFVHDSRFMRMALQEAERAAEAGEVPVGAVLERDGIVLARAHNKCLQTARDFTLYRPPLKSEAGRPNRARGAAMHKSWCIECGELAAPVWRNAVLHARTVLHVCRSAAASADRRGCVGRAGDRRSSRWLPSPNPRGCFGNRVQHASALIFSDRTQKQTTGES